MDSKAKEARREYKREWQRKNRDKCRAQQDRYWTKRAEQAAQQGRDVPFPDPVLRPGMEYNEKTVYYYSVVK